MIKVICTSSEERKQEMEEKYAQYLKLYYNTCLTKREMLKELGVSIGSEVCKNITKRIKEESISPHQRAKLILNGEWLS
jgi:hypothetical protein